MVLLQLCWNAETEERQMTGNPSSGIGETTSELLESRTMVKGFAMADGDSMYFEQEGW